MIPDQQLRVSIEHTLLIPPETKKQFLDYFDFLSIGQKETLSTMLQFEKNILLQYLKTLKSENLVSPEQIQYLFQNELKENIKIQELLERNQTNLENILLSLQTI